MRVSNKLGHTTNCFDLENIRKETKNYTRLVHTSFETLKHFSNQIC